jgi:hypothetical protein
LNGERDGNSKDGARDRRADSFLYLGAEKVGAVNQLTRVEKWVCTWTAAIVATNVIPARISPLMLGSYVVLYLCTAVAIDASLNVVLLILKKQGNWWGW